MSITSAPEYNQQLWRFAHAFQSIGYNLEVPEDEHRYKVDVVTRQVEAPQFLGVEEDHQAERIFFEIDRFTNNIDLAQMPCVIIYKNANQETYAYLVPEYHIDVKNKKLIFSWLLQGPLTEKAGKVQFMIKFFKVNKATAQIEFELNTQVATSAILAAWKNTISDGSYTTVTVDPEFANVFQAWQTAVDEGYFKTYWVDL